MLILAPKRLIGPPSTKERLGDLVRVLAVSGAILIPGALFLTWLATWGERLGIGGYIQLWCGWFGFLVVASTLSGVVAPGSRKRLILVCGLIYLALVAAVWFWSLPFLNLVGIAKPLPIIPIAP
jgi:hypothetical protein